MPGWCSELFPGTQRQNTVAKLAHNPRFLDLFVEDSQRNVYAGELEVRPPDAPTTEPD